MQEYDQNDVDGDLRNWGRFMADQWIEHHLLIAPPPTSEGYIAPMVVYDDPEPVKMPIDHKSGRISEHIVVAIGCECGGFDSYRVLVHYYTRLIFHDCTQDERYSRLSRHMHTSFPGAQRMLTDAQWKFWDRKQTITGLMKVLAVSSKIQ